MPVESAVHTTPLISVALTTFNGERYLRPQLDSLLAQDYRHFELVVVDDGSQDSSYSILQEYAASDSRLRCFRNEANLGFLQNFTRAFSLCEGELIAPCDQDDIWLPEKLTRLYEALSDSRPAAAMAYCDSELIDSDGKPLGRRISDKLILADIHDPLSFAFVNCVSGHSMLFRRTLLDKALPFPETVYHDWWLAFIAASEGGVVYVDTAMVRYRQHDAAQTDFSGSKKRDLRPPGYKAIDLKRMGVRLKAFAAYEAGPCVAILRSIHALWVERENQWIAWKLTRLLVRNRHRLFAFERNNRDRRFRRAIKFFWGLKAKRLVTPRKYVER